MSPTSPPPKAVADPARVLFVALSGFEDSLLSVGLLHLRHLVDHTPDCPGVADWLALPPELLSGAAPAHAAPLASLEHGWAPGDADVLVFSLAHPVLLPWLLAVLDAAGVPALAERRGPAHPVVVVGNLATSNPEPLAPFVDVALIGPAEASLLALVDLAHRDRRAGRPWREQAAALAGAYVPGLYRAADAGGCPSPVRVGAAPARIAAAPADALDYRWTRHAAARILPHRLVISPNLGCRARCRFCRVGQDPYAEAPVRDLRAYVSRGVAGGATHAVVHSLSLSQYRDLAGLVDALDALSVTVGSMRADELSPRKLALLERLSPRASLFPGTPARGRRLVLAPETASRRHMDLLGKHFPEPLLAEQVAAARAIGVTSLMLYFIVGLPGEADDDIAAIAALVARLWGAGGWEAFDVKLTQFEAEPGTPLERAPLASPAVVTARAARLRDLLDRAAGAGRIAVHLEPEPLRWYRALVKRGDRRAGRAALWLHRRGVAPMDVTADAIAEAAAAEGAAMVLDAIAPDAAVPWGFVAPAARTPLLRAPVLAQVSRR